MPEPITDPADELATLRRVNGELKTKSATRKARVAELEASLATLQGQLTSANDSLRQITVEAPLKQMCESISTAPELFQEQFSKRFKLEMVNGALTLQTSDGKPVLNGDAPVPFERQALIQLLTAGDDSQSKVFRSITIASRASGASATVQGNGRASGADLTKPAVQFGLR